MTRFISATYHDAADAEKAACSIIAAGYPPEYINVVMSRAALRRLSNQVDAYPEGAASEAAGSGTIARLYARVAAGGAVAVPIASGRTATQLFVAGPAAAALSGRPSGGAASNLLGIFAVQGMEPDDLGWLEDDLDSGGIVLGISVPDGDRPAYMNLIRPNSARSLAESMARR